MALRVCVLVQLSSFGDVNANTIYFPQTAAIKVYCKPGMFSANISHLWPYKEKKRENADIWSTNVNVPWNDGFRWKYNNIIRCHNKQSSQDEKECWRRERKKLFSSVWFLFICKKMQKKKKTHRKRRVSVKRRKGTVHQKIESQSHVDGKSEEVSSSNTETQLGQVSGRSEIPISLTNDDVIYTKILILNSLCKKP